MHIEEKQVIGERDPDLDWEEDFRVFNYRGYKWKEVGDEDNYYRGKVNILMFEIYIKDK